MEYVLDIKNLSYCYHDNNQVVDNFNLKLISGQHISLVGKNGCGKSTILKLAAGILNPTLGSVYFLKKDINEKGNIDFRPKMSFVFQDPHFQIIGTTPFEDIMFGLYNIGCNKCEAKEKALIISEELSLSDILTKTVYSLSGGEEQILAIAGALSTNPKLLILDEPTTMLDEYHKEIFIQSLKNRMLDGMSILSATHDEELLSISHKIIKM